MAIRSNIIVPRATKATVRRELGLGTHVYDLDNLYSPDTELDKSCVLHMSLYDYPPNYTYAFDRSRYNNHGTLTGTLWTPQGRDFDGATHLITVPDVPSLSAMGAQTLMCWFNQDAQAPEGLISKGDGVGGNNEKWFYVNTVLTITLHSANSANRLNLLGATDASDAKWHLGAATWNGVNDVGTVFVYLDGVDDSVGASTKTLTGCVPHDTAIDVRIGRYYADNTYCFDGKIGEVWIYNRALSAGEIKQIYQRTKWRYSLDRV